MLSAYYNHVRAFENTLVTKFYGLHCVKLTGQPIQKKVQKLLLLFFFSKMKLDEYIVNLIKFMFVLIRYDL